MKSLKLVLIASFLISSLMVYGTAPASANQINSKDIEDFFDNIMSEKMTERHIPNATVTLVAGGEVLLEKGYGYANRNEKKPVEASSTMFRIGSVSKLITWTAVMQLVEQGKLKLDEDINTYLDFRIPGEQPITLTHLMTHTPGFEDYADSIFRLSEGSLLPLDEYVRKFLPARVFPAGEVVAYSNYGTALAGYIVERISGMPFADYAEQNILIPLEMNNSSFRQPLPEEFSLNMAQPYRYIDGEYKEASFEYVPGPAGGMSSTSSDMARFMLAYLQGAQGKQTKILDAKTIQEMFSQRYSQHPSLDGIGLGFIEKTLNGQHLLFHGGSTMLFDTGLYLLPDENIGVFISYSGGNYLTHTEVLQAFMDRYYPVTMTTTTLPPDGTLERSSKYIGEYHQNRRSFTTSESLLSLTMGIINIELDKEGYLSVTHAGETSRFVELEPGVYRNLREGATPDAYGEFRTIVFQTDSSGEVMLASDGPMTYRKAPWYATSGLTFLSLFAAILLFISTLFYWGIAAIIRFIRSHKIQQTKTVMAARWTAVTYGIITLVVVAGVAMNGQINPIYGLPNAAIGMLPAWSPWIDKLPVCLGVIGIIMIVFTVSLWSKKLGSIAGRIHYTLLSFMAIIMMLIFAYWNIY